MLQLYLQIIILSASETQSLLRAGGSNHGVGGDEVGKGNNNGCCNVLLECLDCNDDDDHDTRSCCDVVLDLLFYFFGFLSGQLMLDFVKPTKNTKHRTAFFMMTILELILFILFLLLNASVLVFNFYAIFGHFPNTTMTRGYISGPYEKRE